jgi:drug/metabolite transporter (DMT)-like permease
LYTQTLDGWKELKGANLKIHFFRTLTMVLAVFFAYTGFYLLPMVTMYSIVFLIPLLITIGSVLFLGEVVRWKRFTAIVIGFIGTLISINPFGAEINSYAFIALLCPIFASASYLIVRKYGYEESLFSFLIFGKIFMILFSGIFVFFVFKEMTFNDLVLNAISGISRGTAMIFVINAARHLPGAIFGSILYTQIFAGVFLGYVVFNEIPTINNYIGNLIIIAAGVYIVLREVKLKKNIVTSTARHPTIPIKKD